MARLAHQDAQAHDAQIAALALGVAPPGRSPGVVVAMCVSTFVESNASTSVDKSNRATAARAMAIWACSSWPP